VLAVQWWNMSRRCVSQRRLQITSDWLVLISDWRSHRDAALQAPAIEQCTGLLPAALSCMLHKPLSHPAPADVCFDIQATCRLLAVIRAVPTELRCLGIRRLLHLVCCAMALMDSASATSTPPSTWQQQPHKSSNTRHTELARQPGRHAKVKACSQYSAVQAACRRAAEQCDSSCAMLPAVKLRNHCCLYCSNCNMPSMCATLSIALL
jgi:hypothetical protein